MWIYTRINGLCLENVIQRKRSEGGKCIHGMGASDTRRSTRAAHMMRIGLEIFFTFIVKALIPCFPLFIKKKQRRSKSFYFHVMGGAVRVRFPMKIL